MNKLKRTCNKGFSCGASCIAQGRTCWADFPPPLAYRLKKLKKKIKVGKATEKEQALFDKYFQSKTTDGEVAKIPETTFNKASKQLTEDVLTVPDPRVKVFLEKNNIGITVAPGKKELETMGAKQLREDFLDGLPKMDRYDIMNEIEVLKRRGKTDSPLEAIRELYGFRDDAIGLLTDQEMAQLSRYANMKGSAGITSRVWNHVIIASLSQYGEGKNPPDTKKITASLDEEPGFSTNGDFASRSIENKTTGRREMRLMTAIHEIGHQVEFKGLAKNPTLAKFNQYHNGADTEYSRTNGREAFAESFVMFVFNPSRYKIENPDGYKLMDNYLESAIK